MFKFGFFDFTALLETGATDSLAEMTLEPLNFDVASGQSKAPIVAMQALLPGDDFAGDATTTGVLTVGAPGTVTLSKDGSRDIDWLKIEGATAGDLIEIHVSSNTTLYQTYVDLIVETGQAVMQREGYTFVINVIEEGDFYFSLEHPGGPSGASEVLVKAFDGRNAKDDYLQNVDTSGVLSLGVDYVAVENNVRYGHPDEDWFAVNGDFSQGVTIIDESGEDFYFRIYDSEGTEFSNFYGQPFMSGQQIWNVDDLSYVSVIHSSNSSADLNVKLDLIPDDYSANIETTGQIVLDGENLTLNHDFAGDRDWVAVDLPAGELIEINYTRNEFDFVIRTSDGTIISDGLSYGRAGFNNIDLTFFVPETSGTYFLDFGTYNTYGNTLDVSVSRAVDDHYGNADTLSRLNLGQTETGRFDFLKDEDWFVVEIEEAGIYRLELDFDRRDNGMTLQLVDADGVPLPAIGAQAEQSWNVEVTVIEPGTYYAVAGGSGGNGVGTASENNYAFTIREIEEDIGETFETAATLPINGSGVPGSLNSAIDKDAFKFTAEAGETISFAIVSELATQLTVYNAEGDMISQPWRFDNSYTFDTAGEYYVIVENTPHGFDQGLADYEVVAYRDVDLAGDVTTTASIDVGGLPVVLVLDGFQDSEWLSFEVVEGQFVEFLTNQFAGPDIQIFDTSGAAISDIDEHSNSFLASYTGTFFLGVTSYNGNETDIKIQAQISDDDYSDDIFTTGVVLLDGPVVTGTISQSSTFSGNRVDGLIEGGDSDFFAIDLLAGEGFGVRIDSEQDVSVQILLESGFVVWTNNGNDIETSALRSSQGGRYYISIGADNQSAFESFSYGFSAQSLSVLFPDDIPSRFDEAVALDIDGTVQNSALEFSRDYDTYTITLESEGDLDVSLYSEFHLIKGVALYDNQRQLIDFSYGSDTDINLSVSSLEAGQYFVVAYTNDNGGRDYALSAQFMSYDFAADASTTAEFTGPDDSLFLSNDGTSSEADRDWIAFDVENEDQIFTLFWGDYDAVVRIVDENGQNQFLTSFSHAFKTDPGRYYVEVIHPSSDGSDEEGFELNFSVKYDDYTANEETTARLGEDGSSIFLSHDGVGDFGESDYVGVELSVGELITITAELSSLSEVQFIYNSGWGVPELDTPFTVQETGLYFIQVGHFFSPETVGDGTTLTIRREIADFSADSATLGTILIDGVPTQSQLEEVGDVDWFAVTVEAGDAVNFAVTDQGFTNVQMRLVDADGNNVEGFSHNNNSGPLLDFTHEFSEGGTYYLQVREAFDAWAGSYEITATQLNNPIIGDLDVENEIEGTLYNDVIFGGNLSDRIFGLEGDDVIYGNEGDDFLFGGPGNDSLYAGIGSSRLYGGDGDDQLFATAGDLQFDARLVGGAGQDTIIVVANDPITQVFGDDGDDIISVTGFIQRIDGGAGDDIIDLQGEVIFLFSGPGDDVVHISPLPGSGFFSGGEVFGGAGYDRLEFTVDAFDSTQTFGTWGVFNRDVFNYEFEEIIQRNPSGELLGRATLSGTKIIQTEFDIGNIYPWARRVLIEDSNPNAPWQSKEFFYNDNDNLMSVDTDNGVNVVTYDLAGRFDWASRSITQDVDNDASYQRLEVFYNESGDIIRTKTLQDNGEFTDKLFDMSNTQSYITRELTYEIEGGDLTSINTLFDTGRSNVVTYDIDDSEPLWDLRSETQDLDDTANWNNSTTYYLNIDDSLVRTRFVLERDDSYTSDEVFVIFGQNAGTSVRMLTDTADNQIWESWTFDYNAARQVTQSVRVNDDGIVNTVEYDRDNVEDWSQRSFNEDTADINNWTTTERFIDAAGRTSELILTYDDGRTVRTIYDVSNAQSYDSWRFTSEEGEQTESRRVNDNGVITTVTFDVADTKAWSERSVNEDSSDIFNWTRTERLLDEAGDTYDFTIVYDDGRTVRTLTDTDGSQSYESWRFTSLNGELSESLRTNDNGVIAILTYDLDGAEDWALRSLGQDTADVFNWTTSERLLDADGETLSLEIDYDDGFTVLNEYDLDNEQAWARKVTRTEADGNITEYFYDDDGTLYDTIFG